MLPGMNLPLPEVGTRVVELIWYTLYGVQLQRHGAIIAVYTSEAGDYSLEAGDYSLDVEWDLQPGETVYHYHCALFALQTLRLEGPGERLTHYAELRGLLPMPGGSRS